MKTKSVIYVFLVLIFQNKKTILKIVTKQVLNEVELLSKLSSI